jgi:predicted TIM-barrel fold metal-dependent hydrolase
MGVFGMQQNNSANPDVGMDSPSIIDTDVHNVFKDGKELLEFLPRVWHQHWGNGNLVPGHWPSSVGNLRRDAVTDDGGVPGSDPHFMLKHYLEPCEVDYAILTGQGAYACSVHPDPDFGNAVASAYNDMLAEKWLKVSPRFKGSLLINANDPQAAVQEIDRMASHPDMVQVIMASGARMPYGQRFYHPIYEAAERNGLPVSVHPGTEGRGIACPPTPAGYPTRYMEWHNALTLNFMGHVNSLVCEGVFVKFPKLKFVAIEGGVSWMPHMMWRMDKNYKALRDSVPWLTRLPSEYIKEHIRVTTQPIEEPETNEQLLQILDMVDAKQTLMFSSDYPHWDWDHPKLSLPPLPRELKKRVMWETASELYGLKHKPVLKEGSSA